MSVESETAQRDFLDDVRHFIAENLTPDLQAAGRETTGTHSEIGACRTWHHRLFKKGWIAPAWPVEHGGAGWNVSQRTVFEHECAMNDAPILFAGGIRNMGPLLIEMGTEEQKEQYLPAILSGDDLWCQGFSEPGAGSDLAAIQAKATSDSDEFILNGAKVWTTGAHLANRMFCLVRTEKMDKPQRGISFLMVDMDSPGLTVDPILMINGDHEFNQVHFDNVRVPKANLVGLENDGWTVAKALMRHARSSNTTGGHLHRSFNALRRMRNENGKRLEQRLLDALGSIEIELMAFDALETRCRQASMEQGSAQSDDAQERARASLLKTSATELNQRMTELGMQISGVHANVVSSTGIGNAPELQAGSLATSKYIGLRAASIYSGTNEIHRNLLAHHIQNEQPLVA
jgi:acyl-CoA dehydrogenase